MHTIEKAQSTISNSALIAALSNLINRESVLSEAEDLAPYECDGLSAYRAVPLVVVLPETIKQVQDILALCHQHQVPVVARGAGTGLSGGALPHEQGVLLSLAKFKNIIELNPKQCTAKVQPGVRNLAISQAADKYGLYYAPDPSSQIACTIGGNVATNSGGPHCLKHGVTTDHVAALEVILPDGTPLVAGRGDDGGLDLAGILTGSEGTLGVISRIRVNLAPIATGVRTFLALFDSVADAGKAVGQIFEAGVVPVALELVDRETIAVVEASVFAAGLPPSRAMVSGALLWRPMRTKSARTPSLSSSPPRYR